MSHYFVTDSKLESKRRLITFTLFGVTYEMISDRGVFSKNELDPGTRILLETSLPFAWQGQVGDIGCGIGIVGLVLAKTSPSSTVYLSDINERAVNLARENAQHLALTNTIISIQDGIMNWPMNFNSLWLNPPIRAGKSVMYRLYKEAWEHLVPGGSLFVVIRKDQGAETSLRELESYFSQVHRIAREKGYHVYQAIR